ncbi:MULTISPECIES: HEPN domain-containing protein [unclassified Rhizobium]|uniref:ApeA N-terminal domain 1-containing protein n=1 Tax=unclassified Rhizobium TaxID=2613769 RepID=UPI001620C2E4|nr:MULTISPECIES: HEPN domain-containing protein [unclassified Rhizobium]MBB3381548.1 hypothetical protein [Rhizobium sp. BK098]MBB3613250.1 hypothetical protein [Rhizobium sp. BK609]MBB3678908.1 hypothetical protein [Rhizobium sp. BK612]
MPAEYQNTEALHVYGKFRVEDSEVDGQLVINGRNTELRLHHDDAIHVETPCDIVGRLTDLRQVTLLRCIQISNGQTTTSAGTIHNAVLFPHYIAFGDAELSAREPTVIEIGFELPDGAVVFDDLDAFGTSFEPNRYIADLVGDTASRVKRPIEVGGFPIVQYFTGRARIFECETAIGTIMVGHHIRRRSSKSTGVHIDSALRFNIKFPAPITFDEAWGRMYRVNRLISVLAGRSQAQFGVTVQTAPLSELSLPMEVISTHADMQQKSGPAARDALIDAIRHPSEMEKITKYWIASDDQMKFARGRFFSSFEKENLFEIDRLIVAANTFDVLPSDVFPKRIDLENDFAEALETAKAQFKAFPVSPERDSVLGALGRVQKPNLKQKIRYWSQPIKIAFGDQFSEIDLVTDQAVECRNFYVHGGTPKFDYENNVTMRAFFVRSLEFCFVIGDLLRGSWDCHFWLENGSFLSNPFAQFRHYYPIWLEDLRQIIKN